MLFIRERQSCEGCDEVSREGVIVHGTRRQDDKVDLRKVGNGLYRRLLNSGFTAREIAAMFRVHHNTVTEAALEADDDTGTLGELLAARQGHPDE